MSDVVDETDDVPFAPVPAATVVYPTASPVVSFVKRWFG